MSNYKIALRKTTKKAPGDRTVFKPSNGKIYIFTPYSIHVMKAWPRPTAWKKTTKRYPQWTCFRPSLSWLNLILRRMSENINSETQPSPLWPEEKSPWIQWYETIPADVRTVITPFRKRKWHLLSMIASCGKPAMDLIKSNPALAFALASNWVFHKPAVTQPMRSIRALLQSGKKQTDILKWLGFPATESVRKILMKIPAEEISISNLLTLREAVNTPHFNKMLSSLPRLNNYLLCLFYSQTRFMLTRKLLQEFSDLHEKRSGDTGYSEMKEHLDLLRDTATMHRQLFPETYNHGRIHNLTQLSRYHDLLCNGIDIERFNDLSFPPPPLQGTNEIIPLKTPWDLYEEGKSQHNCVACYSEQVALCSNIYIYRMLKPERCTLEIIQYSSRWTIAQLKASCNSEPSNNAMLAAEKWLNDSQNLL